MIRGSAGCLGIDPTKTKLGQIEFFDEDIDRANRIVLADPVFHAFGKQRPQSDRDRPTKRLIRSSRKSHENLIARSKQAMRFYTGWVIHDRCIQYPCRSMSVVTPIATMLFGAAK